MEIYFVQITLYAYIFSKVLTNVFNSRLLTIDTFKNISLKRTSHKSKIIDI